jgi:DNA mismatch repair protein MutS
MSAPKLTPMMRQYQDIRRELPPNTLLLFRLGDFYEMFFDDAREASSILNVALTKRHDIPMCGVPYHSARGYVAKLVEAGKRVAICDQVGDVTPGKLVRRGLTRILTPGTALEDSQLDSRRGNYLVALSWDKQGWQASWLDVSTADFRLANDVGPGRLLPLLHALAPREVLLPEGLEPPPEHREALEVFLQGRPVSRLPGWNFDGPAGALLVAQTMQSVVLSSILGLFLMQKRSKKARIFPNLHHSCLK